MDSRIAGGKNKATQEEEQKRTQQAKAETQERNEHQTRGGQADVDKVQGGVDNSSSFISNNTDKKEKEAEMRAEVKEETGKEGRGNRASKQQQATATANNRGKGAGGLVSYDSDSDSSDDDDDDDDDDGGILGGVHVTKRAKTAATTSSRSSQSAQHHHGNVTAPITAARDSSASALQHAPYSSHPPIASAHTMHLPHHHPYHQHHAATIGTPHATHGACGAVQTTGVFPQPQPLVVSGVVPTNTNDNNDDEDDVIVPPPDVKTRVDKLAFYVAKNGEVGRGVIGCGGGRGRGGERNV